MNILDFRDEEIIWSDRYPAPIYVNISKKKYLREKYILKNNMNIEGTYNVNVKIGDYERIVINAEVTTVDNHTVITKYC